MALEKTTQGLVIKICVDCGKEHAMPEDKEICLGCGFRRKDK